MTHHTDRLTFVRRKKHGPQRIHWTGGTRDLWCSGTGGSIRKVRAGWTVRSRNSPRTKRHKTLNGRGIRARGTQTGHVSEHLAASAGGTLLNGAREHVRLRHRCGLILLLQSQLQQRLGRRSLIQVRRRSLFAGGALGPLNQLRVLPVGRRVLQGQVYAAVFAERPVVQHHEVAVRAFPFRGKLFPGRAQPAPLLLRHARHLPVTRSGAPNTRPPSLFSSSGPGLIRAGRITFPPPGEARRADTRR